MRNILAICIKAPFFSLLSCWVALRFLYLELAVLFGKGHSGKSKPALVLFSQVPWWGVWQRPQEMARGLAASRQVLFVGPIQVHERIGRYLRARRCVRVTDERDLTVYTPLLFSGHYRFEWVFRLNQRMLRHDLMRRLHQEPAPSLLANTPLGAFLLEGIDWSNVHYDIMDDFAAFDWAPGDTAAMHEALLERADTISTGTHFLLEQTQERGRNATFVPCGVNFLAFRAPDVNETEPLDITGLPRPVIGYTGTLSERIDASLIQELAERHPAASIVLVGPVYRTLGRRPQAPNIHYLGLKPHDALPAYVRRFDVAIMPFRLTEAARAINPVKTLEYLAAGRIVVSTAIPDVVRFYSDTVVIARDRADFVDNVSAALRGEYDGRVEPGIEKARSATWKTMNATIAAMLDGKEVPPCAL